MRKITAHSQAMTRRKQQYEQRDLDYQNLLCDLLELRLKVPGPIFFSEVWQRFQDAKKFGLNHVCLTKNYKIVMDTMVEQGKAVHVKQNHYRIIKP